MSSSVPGMSDLAGQAKLAQDSSLQKMLADEKMRSEQHRTNYQTLQAEHRSLQDEYVSLQNEMRSTIEESKITQDKYKSLLDQAKREKVDLVEQIDDLKTQVVTPQKLEVIKMQVTDELEQPYRDRFLSLEHEVEKFRSEYNRMRKEYSFLKSEYEHEQVEHHRLVEEMTLKHEAEVVNLRKEREALALRQQSDVVNDTQKVRTLQRENAQLLLRLKGLSEELEDVRVKKEHQGYESESVTRVQAKQITESAGNIKALQTERDSLQSQCDNLQRELAMSLEQTNKLTTKVQDLEKDCMLARNKIEEVNHRGKVELTNMKMENLRSCGELERERDRLQAQLDDVASQVEIAKHTIEQQARCLTEKEQESVKLVQLAREEEWEKLNMIENQKLELETKLQEIERRKIDEETIKHQQQEKIEERIRVAEESRITAEKECLVIRTKADNLQTIVNQLEIERKENQELKNKLQHTEQQLNSIVSGENELLEENNKLQNELDFYTEELKKTKEAVLRGQESVDKVVALHRSSFEDEKLVLKSRNDDLEDKLNQLQTKLNNAAILHKKRKKRYTKYIYSLKDKYQLSKAKLEQLVLEKQATKNFVPFEVHNKMKRQMKELWRRHTDYRAVLLSCPSGSAAQDMQVGAVNATCVGPASINLGNKMPDYTKSTAQDILITSEFMPTPTNFDEEERQHQQDLDRIRKRLETLDSTQKQQMEDLTELALRSIPEEKPSLISDEAAISS
ncbi:centrosomal protein of 83 kDa-like [Tubulanus polymorphus]|uniref:centrosomal protein of 83 kDa-like n=1 Tax=Tubulanus polymorphus TaxID=672921 RepID=UPI003DA4AF22